MPPPPVRPELTLRCPRGLSRDVPTDRARCSGFRPSTDSRPPAKSALVPALACIALPAVRTAAISAPEPLRLGSGAGGCCGWDDVDIDRNISINRARSFSASIRHWPAGKAPRTGVRDHLRDLAAFFFSSEKPFAAFRPSGLKSSISWTRRTSMISSSLMGARFAHSIASSRDFTWIIQ
jgi:hypothetical protein